MNWLRLYVDLPRDLKIRREPLSTRWAWIAVMTLTRRSPRPPYLLLAEGVPVRVEDVADEANIGTAAADRAMKTFAERRMVHFEDIEGGLDRVWVATNWRKRQPNSDDINARVSAHRKRASNVTGNGTETPPDTDTEEEAETDSPSGHQPTQSAGARDPAPIERARALAVPKPSLAPGSPHLALQRAIAAALHCAEPETASERRKWSAPIAEMVRANVTPAEVPRLVAVFTELNSVPCTPQGIVNQLNRLRSDEPVRPTRNGRSESTRDKLDRVFGSIA